MSEKSDGQSSSTMAAKAASASTSAGRRRKTASALGGSTRQKRRSTLLNKLRRPASGILPKRRSRFGLGGRQQHQQQPVGTNVSANTKELPATRHIGDVGEGELGASLASPVSVVVDDASYYFDDTVSGSTNFVSASSDVSSPVVEISSNATKLGNENKCSEGLFRDHEVAFNDLLDALGMKTDSTAVVKEEQRDFDDKDKDEDEDLCTSSATTNNDALDDTIECPSPSETENVAPDAIKPDTLIPIEDGDNNSVTEESVKEEIIAISSQSQDSIESDGSDGTTSPALEASNNDDDVSAKLELRTGATVRVISKGKYEGKTGIVSRITAKQVYVTFPGIAKDPRLPKTSVVIIGREEGTGEIGGHNGRDIGEAASAAATVPSNRDGVADLGPGQAVNIDGGTYEGHKGTVVKVTAKMVWVDIMGVGKKKVFQEHVEISPVDMPMQLDIPLNCDSAVSSCISLATGIVTPTSKASNSNVSSSVDTSSTSAENGSNQSETNNRSGTFSEFSIHQEVIIKAGEHKGKKVKITGILPKSLKVEYDAKEVTVRKKSIEGYVPVTRGTVLSPRSLLSSVISSSNLTAEPQDSARSSEGDEWRVPDSQAGGTRFGSRIVEKMRLTSSSQKVDNTFLSHILGNRIRIVEIALNAEEVSMPFDVSIQENGYRYELISAKVRKDGDSPSLQYCKKQCVCLMYAQVTGPCLETLCLERTLQDIADFSSLSSRKVMARLELLQSPALMLPNKRPAMFFINASDTCDIADNGNDGCGFICEKYLVNLLGGKKYAKDTQNIQVRVCAHGIYKGMLMKKRIVNGPPIQLTPTMKKVPASTTNPCSGRACLVITQAGRHPTKLNECIGRMLDPSLKPPPKKSFENLIKPLNKHQIEKNKDMIPRLFQAVGVPLDVRNDYVKRSKKPSGLKHAYIVGVADPTNALPSGHVLVTGFCHVTTPKDEIFVTRSPCVKASDARMVPMVTSKPDAMSQQDWDWLSAFPFGTLIFANPDEGFEPLPAQIAKGDLDGDLYFICWDKELIKYIKTDPIVKVGVVDLVDDASASHPHENWLEEAQQMMIDSIAIQELGALTGELYTLSTAIADKSTLFMRDPDAIAFADAFNQALEFGKHGGKIALPLHLHRKVSTRLRKHLSAPTR